MDRKKLEARVARLEKSIKNEDAELSRLIEATHNTVNDLIDTISNHEKQSKFLDMIIHKEDKAIDTIIDFIANHYYYDFSKGYLLSKRSVIADEASEVAGALAIYSDWEDKGYFDGDGDFDESVNRRRKKCKNESFRKLTVGELIDFLGKFDANKEVQFEMGNVFRPIDAGDIYDAGDSVNFDFTYIMKETSGW